MKHPDVVFKQNYPVFSSERIIYGTDSKHNHRLKSPIVYDALFEDVKVDASCLQSLLIKGASTMQEKLASYPALFPVFQCCTRKNGKVWSIW